MLRFNPINVLFLCTGNSARSIMSEAILNDIGKDNFIAWSAGSKPSKKPHPDALRELFNRGHTIESYRSKSWSEFTAGPAMDIVITVCDNAAKESCPIFPGKGIKIHWPAFDPVSIGDPDERAKSFCDVYDIFYSRITKLVSLPLECLSNKSLLQSISN